MARNLASHPEPNPKHRRRSPSRSSKQKFIIQNPTWTNKISDCCKQLRSLSLDDTPITIPGTLMKMRRPPSISKPGPHEHGHGHGSSMTECARELSKLSLMDYIDDDDEADRLTEVLPPSYANATKGKKFWSSDNSIFAKYANPMTWFTSSTSTTPTVCYPKPTDLNTQHQTYHYNNENLSVHTTLTSSTWGNNPFYVSKTATAEVYYKSQANPMGLEQIIPSKSMFACNNDVFMKPDYNIKKLGAMKSICQEQNFQEESKSGLKSTWIKVLICLSIILNLLFIIGLLLNYFYVSKKLLDVAFGFEFPFHVKFNFNNYIPRLFFSSNNLTASVVESPLDLTYDLVGQIF